MSGLLTTLGSTHSWAPLALSVSWQLALFALLAWALEHPLRQPRARYALWWFVLLAPLVLTPLRAHLEARQALVAVPAPPALARATAVSLAPVAAPPAEEPIGAPVIPVTPIRHSWYPQALDLLKDLWLLAAFALSLRLLTGYRQIRRLVRQSHSATDDAVLAMLRDLSARAGVRSLELRASADVTAAVLCGVRRPVILVPEEWLCELPPDELRALLAHEVAHVRRRDVAANLAQRVLEAFLSLHPGTWLVSRRITTAREEACDAWAIGQGADPAEYARSLARAAARAEARFAVASVGLAEGKSRLLQRVEAVMRLGTMGAVSRRVVIAVVTVLAVCAIGFAAVRMAQPGGNTGATIDSQHEARVAQNQGPLSSREAEEALQQLGLRTYRLTYELPFAHRLLVQVDEYRHGQLVKTLLGYNGGGTAGENTFLLFTREADSQLSFSGSVLFGQDWREGGGSAGMGGVSLKGITGARYYGRMPVPKLEVGKRTPFWSFCADSSNRPHGSPESERDVPKFAAAHDLALVAYVTLSRTEPTTQPAPPNLARQTTVDFTALWEDGRPAAGAKITIGTFDSERAVLTSFASVTADADGKARWIGEVPGAERAAEVGVIASYADPKAQARSARRAQVLPQVFPVLLRVGGHETMTLTLRTLPAEAPAPVGDRALLGLTVLRADGKPAAGAALTVEGRMPWERPVWHGETDAQGKATVVIEHPQPNTRARLLISHAGPGLRDVGLPTPVALELGPGTRTSATVTIPRGVRRIESAPRNAEEAAARAKRDRYWAELQERQKAEQAERDTYWRRRRAEVAAMPVSRRRAMTADVQARLHQLKAKAQPLEARMAELDKLEQAIVNRLRGIEAESPGAQTPEGMALRDRFSKITAERSAVDQQLQPLLEQRSRAERELSLLQRGGDA